MCSKLPCFLFQLTMKKSVYQILSREHAYSYKPTPQCQVSEMQYRWRFSGAQGGEGREASPALFLKIKKSALILGKKCPDCVHSEVKFVIQNVVLRVSKRKKLQNFCLFIDFFDKIFIEVL